jgi:hypothetical protein
MSNEPTLPESVKIDAPFLQRIPLEGEGSDRAYQTENGRKFRVKIRKSDEAIAHPAPGVTTNMAAPTSVTLTVSLAELDEGNAVKMSGGRYLIFDRHEILITNDQLQRGIDVAATIDEVIERLAREAEAVAEGKAQTAATLADWGIDF